MPGRAAGLGRSACSMMEFISVEDPSFQTAGLSPQHTASQSKSECRQKLSKALSTCWKNDVYSWIL